MKTEKSYKDMTREERKAAAQARAQAALDRIGDGVRSVWSSEAWAQWLQTLAKFHDYSLNNTMLIAMQMPEATRVASYRSWQRDFGRHVKKGEHGIEVLVPMVVKSRLGDPEETPRDDAEEAAERRRLVGFKVGHVFDVSQTEGEPLPTIAERVTGDVERYDEVMGAIRAVSAYPVEIVDGLPPETNGLFSRMGYIAIRAGMPQGQTVKTALHELAHSVLHDGSAEQLPDRAMREVQAESVAYAVSAALGLDTSDYSFGYVASWAIGKTDEEMRRCMQLVRDAAKDIIDKMDIVLAA
ncbi:MAG: ArdC family protein [Coriobacteriales bacterium]|nr:ArdC family protein [Coriobacteriales bacterium]